MFLLLLPWFGGSRDGFFFLILFARTNVIGQIFGGGRGNDRNHGPKGAEVPVQESPRKWDTKSKFVPVFASRRRRDGRRSFIPAPPYGRKWLIFSFLLRSGHVQMKPRCLAQSSTAPVPLRQAVSARVPGCNSIQRRLHIISSAGPHPPSPTTVTSQLYLPKKKKEKKTSCWCRLASSAALENTG